MSVDTVPLSLPHDAVMERNNVPVRKSVAGPPTYQGVFLFLLRADALVDSFRCGHGLTRLFPFGPKVDCVNCLNRSAIARWHPVTSIAFATSTSTRIFVTLISPDIFWADALDDFAPVNAPGTPLATRTHRSFELPLIAKLDNPVLRKRHNLCRRSSWN